jgi:cell division transport system permease protein
MTLLTTLRRILKYGVSEFFRNGVVTISTILVMSITLFVIGTMLFTQAALESTLETIRSKVDVNVYFLPAASETQVLELRKSIQGLPEVFSVEYVSKEQALTQFRERHKDDQLMIQAVEEIGDNPLGASLSVRAKDTSQYEAIVKFIEGSPALQEGSERIIERVNYSENKAAIDRLNSIIRATESAGIIIAIFLAIASMLIVFNTVRLGIYTARDEIAVMRLVGASSWYARGPFIVQGFLYGFAAGVFTLVILYPLAYWLGPVSESFFGTFNMYVYYLDHILMIMGVILVSGVLLGSISSFIAVRRYLSV